MCTQSKYLYNDPLLYSPYTHYNCTGLPNFLHHHGSESKPFKGDIYIGGKKKYEVYHGQVFTILTHRQFYGQSLSIRFLNNSGTA